MFELELKTENVSKALHLENMSFHNDMYSYER